MPTPKTTINDPEFVISIKQSWMFGEQGIEAEIRNCKTDKLRCLYAPNHNELFKGISNIFDVMQNAQT